MRNVDTITGIDEAGRGPLAGPVYLGIVAVPADFDFTQFAALTDSKQMSEAAREELFEQLANGAYPDIAYTVTYSTSTTIDSQGINPAIQRAINRGLRQLSQDPDTTQVYLDGGLSAPKKYSQQTIIRGDEKESVISLASVLAKVARDRKMRRMDQRYAEYGFARHKGYGTKAHREQIEKRGPCEIHRQSYLGKCYVVT